MLCTLVCNVIKYSDCVFLKDNNESSMNLELKKENKQLKFQRFYKIALTFLPVFPHYDKN